MDAFQLSLTTATLLCSLVAGFVLAFACVVMPGLGTLNDRAFLHAFQVVDRVIQNNQPIFLLVWVGSIVALVGAGLLGAGFLGAGRLEGAERWILLGTVVLYLGGVQAPTLTVNVPLNNQLQALDVETLDEATLAEARRAFEPRWNRWNVIRTVVAILVSAMLIVLVLRL